MERGVEERRSRDKMKCIGYGIYEGKCPNEAGTQWALFWCKRCYVELRKETITKHMEEISESFNPRVKRRTK